MREINLYIRRYSLSLFIALFIIFLLGTLYYSGSKLYSTKTHVDSLTKDIASLQKQLNTSTSADVLSNEDLKTYQQLMSHLIPENEDAFSILFALEKLSIDSGFNVLQYAVNLSQSTNGKLSINVTGTGNTDSFFKFLNNYNFSGGRLITVDKVSLGGDSGADVQFVMNFYSQKTNSLTSGNKILTASDLELLQQIKDKTGFVLKQDESAPVQYDVKSNPF